MPTEEKSVSISFNLPIRGLEGYLASMTDPRRDALLAFHARYRERIMKAKGSKTKHQAWEGGYADHLVEMFTFAEMIYSSFREAKRPLPFSLDSVWIVSYFHDLEKPWKYYDGDAQAVYPEDAEYMYADGTPEKQRWYNEYLAKFNICLTEDELNALEYAHGEPANQYNPETRVMGPLASFLHIVDNMSARIWYDEKRGASINGSF